MSAKALRIAFHAQHGGNRVLFQQAGVPPAVHDSTLRSAIDSMGIGVSLLTLRCQFVAFNQAYDHLVGRSPAEAPLSYLADVTHQEDRQAVGNALDQLRSGAHLKVDLTRRTLLPSGGFRWVSEHYSLQQAIAGGEAQIVALTINVHDQHMAQQALKENGDPLGFARLIAGSLQPACDLSEALENLVILLANPSEQMPQNQLMEYLTATSEQLTKVIRDTFFLARKRYLGS